MKNPILFLIPFVGLIAVFASMSIVELADGAVLTLSPEPFETYSPTPTISSTPIATAILSPTPTNTQTPTATATLTPSSSVTSTPTPTPNPTTSLTPAPTANQPPSSSGTPDPSTMSACHTIRTAADFPQTENYGPPYNVVSGTGEMLIEVMCGNNGENVTAIAGTNNPLDYVYDKGYVFRDNQWHQLQFYRMNINDQPVENQWFASKISSSFQMDLGKLNGEAFALAFICHWDENRWKCGCKDTACTDRKWNVQAFQRTSTSPAPTSSSSPTATTSVSPTATSTISPSPTSTGEVKACTTDLKNHLGSAPGLSAAIVKNGRVVCTAVAGFSDTSQNKPVTPDTAFTWASVSKTVTATALLTLFDQGKYKLDDDISEYIGFQVQIPSCPGTPVTFRHLLTHTSGIKDGTIYDSLYVTGDSPIPLSEFIPGYLNPGGKYYNQSGNFNSDCPGTNYDYSNIGTGAIGYLVEKISGKSFEQYTADQIFTPLGMSNTSFKLTGMDQSMLAKPNGNGPHQGGPTFPDGTLRSSPANLGKVMAAYMQDGQYNGYQLLNATTVKEALKSQTSASDGQGLIWYENSLGWGHDGGDPGISSEIGFDPTTKVGILIVANGESSASDEAIKELLQEANSY